MEYKNMSDSELASVMLSYINRVKQLKNAISQYINYTDGVCMRPQQIKDEYRELKDKLRNDAKYLYLVKNRNGSVLYTSIFTPSIREASAFGFTVPVNAAINYEMYSAVEEAYYKLRKYYSLDKWEELVEKH
ncbi:MAG: hypothetical protein IJY23_04770 [Clostridia bacterium]|nr:hypothetical protein [Clostridia bacterium]